MRDLAIRLENRPGALAEMGEALGSAGVSVEGGGAFVFDGKGIAHFLFEDAVAARKASRRKGNRSARRSRGSCSTTPSRSTWTIRKNFAYDGRSWRKYRGHL